MEKALSRNIPTAARPETYSAAENLSPRRCYLPLPAIFLLPFPFSPFSFFQLLFFSSFTSHHQLCCSPISSMASSISMAAHSSSPNVQGSQVPCLERGAPHSFKKKMPWKNEKNEVKTLPRAPTFTGVYNYLILS